MATGPKIVHKQFNSPIGLYSQRNIQDTLNKHLQNLDNGTVGKAAAQAPRQSQSRRGAASGSYCANCIRGN
ncbi:hypothetical protein MSG28_002857 [Choristoneura fumiferana]|uniref:Uncharacterized protein n=1 Tax=Choristoneura fumiferana TaxID=7141 RepID=A0ACC0JJM7_CHOFU|nr:hypothetical protein MSG28_002857 [Choristoneura fumiferana]